MWQQTQGGAFEARRALKFKLWTIIARFALERELRRWLPDVQIGAALVNGRVTDLIRTKLGALNHQYIREENRFVCAHKDQPAAVGVVLEPKPVEEAFVLGKEAYGVGEGEAYVVDEEEVLGVEEDLEARQRAFDDRQQAERVALEANC